YRKVPVDFFTAFPGSFQPRGCAGGSRPSIRDGLVPWIIRPFASRRRAGRRTISYHSIRRANARGTGRALVGDGAAPMSADRCMVLVVDDEPYLLPTLRALLEPDFDVLTAESADEAEKILAARPIDILLTDQRMPRKSGVQLLEWAKE